MKLKGINKLNKELTRLVNAFICPEAELHFSTMFQVADNDIYYSLFVEEECDKFWDEWLRDNYEDIYSSDWSLWLLSLLHEVGHIKTLDDFDTDDFKEEKEELAIDADKDNDEERRRKNRGYWDLEIEKAATDWAVIFYAEHEPQMKIFYKLAMRAISDFYNKNITED